MKVTKTQIDANQLIAAEKRQSISTDRISKYIAVRWQDVLSPDKRQERREDLSQLLHVQVPSFHSPFINAVGCATQQIGFWEDK